MTLIHTFATIFFLLGVLAHLAALIFKVNRPLVKSIFSGEIDAEYARERHTLWYDELKTREPIEKEEVQVEAEVKHEEEERAMAALGVEERQTEKEDNPMTSTIKVKGMSCQHCVMSVTKALSQLEGVKNIQVDLAKGEVRFDNLKEVASNRIEKAITDAGYEVVQA
jgi:copper ion binding protein